MVPEAGLPLDTEVNTRTGGVIPVRIARAVLGRPEGGTTETETVVVATTEGGRDPTAGHPHPEGIGTEGIPETQMKRNS